MNYVAELVKHLTKINPKKVWEAAGMGNYLFPGNWMSTGSKVVGEEHTFYFQTTFENMPGSFGVRLIRNEWGDTLKGVFWHEVPPTSVEDMRKIELLKALTYIEDMRKKYGVNLDAPSDYPDAGSW